jgi:hypothetical protein
VKRKDLQAQIDYLLEVVERLQAEVVAIKRRMPAQNSVNGTYWFGISRVRSRSDVCWSGSAIPFTAAPIFDLVTRDEMQKAIEQATNPVKPRPDYDAPIVPRGAFDPASIYRDERTAGISPSFPGKPEPMPAAFTEHVDCPPERKTEGYSLDSAVATAVENLRRSAKRDADANYSLASAQIADYLEQAYRTHGVNRAGSADEDSK